MSFQPARAASIVPTHSDQWDGGTRTPARTTEQMIDEASSAVVQAVSRALAVADMVTAGGYTRATLAARLGVSVETVNDWFKARRRAVPPRTLAAMMMLPVFPPEARAELFNAMVQRGRDGLVVCKPMPGVAGAELGGGPIVLQVLGAQASIGGLADRMRMALEPGSAEGELISALEARQLLDQAVAMTAKAAQVESSLRAMVERKKGAGR